MKYSFNNYHQVAIEFDSILTLSTVLPELDIYRSFISWSRLVFGYCVACTWTLGHWPLLATMTLCG